MEWSTFIWPLYGMHRRLVEDKGLALREVHQAIEATFQRLQGSLGVVDLAATDTLAKQIESLLRQEEYVSRLPTWPWPPGTLARLASVALLPLLLLIAQILIERLLATQMLR
ncbi:MAG TPA: hypothetical protein VNK95_19420 [Caldilineaceae bacterium]|nr:hypothetical protein [Caldilineaceae bacterium]